MVLALAKRGHSATRQHGAGVLLFIFNIRMALCFRKQLIDARNMHVFTSAAEARPGVPISGVDAIIWWLSMKQWRHRR